MLAALAGRETQQRAGDLGSALVAALAERVPVLSGNPLRHAAFRVLKAPDVPSALVELGFLSNADDRNRLRDAAWRDRAVSALVAGLAGWYAGLRG
jgi:N-acetylmuramoyl-L-alanine amidase